MNHRISYALILGALISQPAFAAPSSKYAVSSVSVTDLGTLGGAESEAHDINDQGQIVGRADRPNGIHYPFLYDNGGMLNLSNDMLGIPGSAYGINNNTEVVGGTEVYINKAFHWQNGTVTILHDQWFGFSFDPATPTWSTARKINDYGRITGEAGIENYNAYGMYWITTGIKPIKLTSEIHTFSRAHDINNSNDIVGYYNFPPIDGGYVYQGGQLYPMGPLYISPTQILYGSASARGVNDNGFVTGFRAVEIDGEYVYRALIWRIGNPYSFLLNHLPDAGDTYGRDINDNGFIVGDTILPGFLGGSYSRAFFYHPNFGMILLPPPQGAGQFLKPSSCKAYALNERKPTGGLVQVAGYCTVQGKKHAMRWDVIVKIKSLIKPPISMTSSTASTAFKATLTATDN